MEVVLIVAIAVVIGLVAAAGTVLFMRWRRDPLNPGSQSAGRSGCTCPVTMNNDGKKKPAKGWIKRSSCPVHGEMEMRSVREG